MKNTLKRILLLSMLVFVLLLMIGVPFEVNAAITGKISGRVMDSQTGEPLPYTNIVVLGTDLGATAAEDGYFSILRIPPGTYSVRGMMMGYKSVTVTGVIVSIDHTTNLNFRLTPTLVEGEGVTVSAERPIIKRDVSSTQFSLREEEIKAIPMSNPAEMLAMQAGVHLSVNPDEAQGLAIRGGSADQSDFQVDNISLKSGYSDLYQMNVPLTSISEVQLLSGGFNAEYGQVRSGLVNIVTKRPSMDKYAGDFEFRIGPPTKKHWGPNPYDPDESPIWDIYAGEKAFEGITEADVDLWDSTGGEEGYPVQFKGWNAIAQDYLNDDDTTNDMTPMNALEIWKYEHRPRAYADEPDYDLDVTFGGPIPILPKSSFMLSYRRQKHQYIFPLSRKEEKKETYLGKLAYSLTPDIKLEVQSLYGTSSGSGLQAAGGQTAAAGSFSSSRFASEEVADNFAYQNMFASENWSLNDQEFVRVAAKLTHVLNPNTYHELQYVYGKNWLNIEPVTPDTVTVTIGDIEYTEIQGSQWPNILDQPQIFRTGGYSNSVDYSKNWTHMVKWDLSSQLNKYNEIKTGLGVTLPSYRTRSAYWTWGLMGDTAIVEEYPECVVWDADPVFANFYAQDKLEFEGMIANVGVRFDYMDPKANAYDMNTLWDPYFTPANFVDDAGIYWAEKRTLEAEAKIKIQPRIGVSFPVSTNSKLYFNYGHFYMTPNVGYLYGVKGWSKYSKGATLPNPNLDWPRTVAYEFGYEQTVANFFKIHAAAYYKDITGELYQVTAFDWDHTVETTMNGNYQYSDIKGLDLRVSRPWGRFLTFWANYDYAITTYGYTVTENVYENPLEQAVEDKNAEDERPVVKPFLRAGLTLKTPGDWGPGPVVLGKKILGGLDFNFMYRWEDGGEFIFNPNAATEDQHWLEYVNKSFTDLKISKNISFGGTEGKIFVDIYNLFDQKYLYTGNFSETELSDYRISLHLPWEEGAEQGNDKYGEYEKEYIDIGWRNWIRFLNPRTVNFGISFSF